MSDISLVWLLALQFIFIFLNAIFASAEIAVITINDNKLERMAQNGDKRAVRLKKLTENSSDFLATIQIGITLVNLLSSAVATENFSSRLVSLLSSIGIAIPEAVLSIISLVVITLLLTYFTVVLGELVPKQIALKNPEKIALFLSGLVSVISKMFTPVVRLFSASTTGIVRLFGLNTNEDENENTEEEIRLMLDIGAKKGQILPDEETMIHNVFEFDDISIENIMTHRTEVVFLWMDDTEKNWEKTIREGQHSIYPVCKESTDNIIGILYTKDYFRVNDKDIEYLKNIIIRPVNYVLETVKADVLFRNMKQTKDRFAVVIDEFGGTSGIITMNDLLEQIVGEFNDNILMSGDSLDIKPLNQGSWQVSGKAPIDKIAAKIGLDLPIDRYNNLNEFYINESKRAYKSESSIMMFKEYGFAMKNIQIKDEKLEKAIIVKIN
ncbi:putative hemolysin [Marinilactibacillus piezotolerans]|uniref:Putative hemolysin n=1 Tax=Marinilactibacillus piezotolerans TaxID=258723 RepID=A0A1I3URN6_9LACT|nr:hemolysin family protein [Marinilactibacillus piezotolerans]SFJ84501.1 putative hemolysin [Marinilactibacillus piezotolerans]